MNSSAHQNNDNSLVQQTLQNHGRKTPTHNAVPPQTHLRQSLNIDSQSRGASGGIVSANSPQVIIDEAANLSLTSAGQPIMFTTGPNSVVKAKNNQPT